MTTMSIPDEAAGLAQLQRAVRQALHHLYDPLDLRRSPLPQMLGLAEPLADPAALRQALVATIARLAPPPGTPVDSNAARIYQVLTYRFVEQSPQQEVANDLALSIRQLRRLEAAAVEVLADALAQRYHVDLAPWPPWRTPRSRSPPCPHRSCQRLAQRRCRTPSRSSPGCSAPRFLKWAACTGSSPPRSPRSSRWRRRTA